MKRKFKSLLWPFFIWGSFITSICSFAAEEDVNQIFAKVAEKVMPSVVNISTSKLVRNRYFQNPYGHSPFPADEFWQRFFDMGPQGDDGGEVMMKPQKQAYSLGSGFVMEVDRIKQKAYIITNEHVIKGADEVSVRFSESPQEPSSRAKVIGSDKILDLALLEVSGGGIKNAVAVPLGDSDALKVGEWIAALGNPFGHGHSMTHGIVSAKERSLPGAFGKYLQVDAPINPGNSGGPLVNLKGEVIGISNAIDARGPGIGFAIPVNTAKRALADLKSKGAVQRGFIGIQLVDARQRTDIMTEAEDEDQEVGDAVVGKSTAMVADAPAGLPAYVAGIRRGDIITAIDNLPIRTSMEVIERVSTAKIGDSLKVTIQRRSKELSFNVRVTKKSSRMAEE